MSNAKLLNLNKRTFCCFREEWSPTIPWFEAFPAILKAHIIAAIALDFTPVCKFSHFYIFMLGNCCNQKVTAPRTLMSEKSPLDPQPSQGFNRAMGLQLGYVFPQNEVIAELIAHTTQASRLSSKVLDTNQSHRLRAILNREGTVFLNFGPTSADRKTPLFFSEIEQNVCQKKTWKIIAIFYYYTLNNFNEQGRWQNPKNPTCSSTERKNYGWHCSYHSNIHCLHNELVNSAFLKPLLCFASLTQLDLLCFTFTANQLEINICVCTRSQHISSFHCQMIWRI